MKYINSLKVANVSLAHDWKHTLQVIEIGLVKDGDILKLFASFEWQVVYHTGTLLRVSFENFVQKRTEGLFLWLVKVDDHADVQKGDLDCRVRVL